jgi:hypothetical protein
MTKKAPPIPDENRSHKGPGEPAQKGQQPPRGGPRPNANSEGRADNIRQNTNNQGFQQDR